MPEKHPTWTRTRVGRNRVHWVAYDDRSESGDRAIVDQGYAASLAEADVAARAALAASGMYQARRQSKGFGQTARVKSDGDREKSPRPARPARVQPREYLYTRHHVDQDDAPLIAAHRVLKKTARRVYVTRRSIGPDQVGTEDETWEPDERAIALDRAKLERDGSVYSGSHPQSDFFASREAALGEFSDQAQAALDLLEIRSPCTVEDVKTAYRRRALEVHPDRGGNPGDFQAVEAAYRRLLREAQAPEA
jgi:DnaJ domain